MLKRRIVLLLLFTMVFSKLDVAWANTAEPSSWAENTIQSAKEIGFNYTVYNYQANITRRDMCYIIYNLIGFEMGSRFQTSLTKDVTSPFTDVSSSAKEILACYQAGIVSGISATQFGPEEPLTREQAAVILVRAIRYLETVEEVSVLKNSGQANVFEDNGLISSWAKESVALAQGNNMMSGDGANFNPQNFVTYEQGIIMVYNTYQALEKAGLPAKYSSAELERMQNIATRAQTAVYQQDQYVIQPNIAAPYSAGQVQTAYIQTGIDNINLARYIAGLPDNVVLGSEYIEQVQAAAVAMAANKELSHSPSKPSGMSDSLYTLAKSGASSSNISYNSSIPASVWSYMNDSDDSNIDRVGHRRWILCPVLGKTAFGSAGAYTVMYAFDESNTQKYQGIIAWPANVFPLEQLQTNLAWSVSPGQDYFSGINTANIKVTLQRERDNKTWQFNSKTSTANGSYFNINSTNYGRSGPAIIFRPDYKTEEDLYIKNDVFHVTVEGLAKPLSYTVKVFSTDDARKIPYTTAVTGN